MSFIIVLLSGLINHEICGDEFPLNYLSCQLLIDELAIFAEFHQVKLCAAWESTVGGVVNVDGFQLGESLFDHFC